MVILLVMLMVMLPKGVPATHELRKHRFKDQNLLLNSSFLKMLWVSNFIPYDCDCVHAGWQTEGH